MYQRFLEDKSLRGIDVHRSKEQHLFDQRLWYVVLIPTSRDHVQIMMKLILQLKVCSERLLRDHEGMREHISLVEFERMHGKRKTVQLEIMRPSLRNY